MNHAIYHVRGFEIVGRYVLRVASDDGTAQTIDFEPVLAGELFAAIRHFFGRSGSIPRSIRSYGPTVPISNRRAGGPVFFSARRSRCP